MLGSEARERIIVAIDCGRGEALELADALAGHARWLKVGMTLYYAEGPAIVSAFKERGFKVFLDLKFHDIPHQVRGAVKSAAHSGADLVTVHGSGSEAMLRACHEGAVAAREAYGYAPYVIAITVLTSIDQAELAKVGVERAIPEQAAALAKLACDSGLDGIVCSPQEAAAMRELLGEDALIVTPGVRPAGAELGDQSRVATPAAAIAAGASHIVVGRPITQAEDVVEAFEAIVAELEQA